MCERRCLSRRDGMKVLGAAAIGVFAAPSLAAGQQKPAAGAIDVAVERMSKGHNCAQSVFSACAEQMGMDYQTALNISAGFGGGMMVGGACGAVTGGIMAIGLKRGGPGADSRATMKLVRQFTDRFKAKYKSVNCADLTGIDTSKFDVGSVEALTEAYKTAVAKGTFANCLGYVRDAATMVTEILAEPAK